MVANFQRWYDEETDELLRPSPSTDDEAEQRAAIDGLQRIMVEQMPALPIVTAPNWFQLQHRALDGFRTSRSRTPWAP